MSKRDEPLSETIIRVAEAMVGRERRHGLPDIAILDDRVARQVLKLATTGENHRVTRLVTSWQAVKEELN
jgi:hypothetical protein